MIQVNQTSGNFEIIANTNIGEGWNKQFCFVCENRAKKVTQDLVTVTQQEAGCKESLSVKPIAGHQNPTVFSYDFNGKRKES